MTRLIYIEEDILEHPRVKTILKRFPSATSVPCHHYGEIFNRKAQNFRLQKRRPALILARKRNRFIMPAPNEYAIGASRNFYFSHMLNCPYDCRYCFLQGMYRSAHYLLFINYEDFGLALNETMATDKERTHFFSGYDSDSLAFDGISGFLDYILPFFRQHQDRACLELRTKCSRIAPLLAHTALPNCIVAFSFTPQAIAQQLEHGVPALRLRLRAMARLQDLGWPIGLRFDPMIYAEDFRAQYQTLFKLIFSQLSSQDIHSVSLGGFRLPEGHYQNMIRIHPDEPLLFNGLTRENGMVAYPKTVESDMIEFCTQSLSAYVPDERIFPCMTLT